jgi:phosphatidylserine decarboxylase
MNEQIFMSLMRVLPRSALSTMVGHLTRLPAPSAMHQSAMRLFAKSYGVNLEEAEHGVDGYATFAQFFTRRLKLGARPIEAGARSVVSPVDGVVSQVGTVQQGRCIQAKGIDFPVDKLLGGAEQARRFEGGAFTTIYLSPKDYHRIHAPLEGGITGYTYLPGEFWPVNPASVNNVDALFAVNERLVTWFDTEAGQVAVVAVGATCVARIHASYDVVVTHTGQAGKAHRYAAPIATARGAEIGIFEMGSTVILLFEKGRVTLSPRLAEGTGLRLGEKIGERT